MAGFCEYRIYEIAEGFDVGIKFIFMGVVGILCPSQQKNAN